MDELKSRGILRSFNNPVADYSETLVSLALGLRLEPNSNQGYDAVDSEGARYQIKGRVIRGNDSLHQLGVIRKLVAQEFHFLIAVLFDQDFAVIEAYRIPHRVIARYAKYNDHQHGHILRLRGKITEDPEVERIGNLLRVTLLPGRK